VDPGDAFNRRHWLPAFTRAGLTYVPGNDGMHALRHFYASTLLAQGVTIKELADYLGHTDPGFTLRTYTHLLPSSHEQARRAVDSVFKPRRPEKVVSGPGTA
jgi:integrase